MIVIKVLVSLALLSVVLYFVPFVLGPMMGFGLATSLNLLLGFSIGAILFYLWEDELS